ncbi:hypothetical protein GTO91_12955 [Heliobacterium undosum]|uniref:Uncharacterized protein n=1 Tax=Heliomicrobium undosum TaxID=121734 RepID=A0A845L2Z7_9FIRM|nr:hypothetical protein [Heliomicrobium undosum]MZP30623.1 hypothetical protein [Heliomicrobium undosum]
MQHQLIVHLTSPLLAGDRKEPGGYFLPSRDFIPGALIRAAVAREITACCPYALGRERLNWVAYEGADDCLSCTWKNWCQHFDKITFSHAYPPGARMAPMSAYRCKTKEDHGVFDGLLALLKGDRVVCPVCSQGKPEQPGRAERCSGLMDAHVSRRLMMRLAVDPYRGTSQDGQLFAIRAVSTGQHFASTITAPGDMTLNWSLTEMRVGAKTSVGLGRVQTQFVQTGKAAEGSKADHEAVKALAKRLESFNRYLRENRFLYPAEQKTYFSLTLLSETIPQSTPEDVDDGCEEYRSTKRLQTQLASRVLCGLPGLETVLVLADYTMRGGFDTSASSALRRPSELYLTAGSVFVFAVPGAADDDLIQKLYEIEMNGLGCRTSDGYGAVSVCDDFHWNGGK